MHPTQPPPNDDTHSNTPLILPKKRIAEFVTLRATLRDLTRQSAALATALEISSRDLQEQLKSLQEASKELRHRLDAIEKECQEESEAIANALAAGAVVVDD